MKLGMKIGIADESDHDKSKVAKVHINSKSKFRKQMLIVEEPDSKQSERQGNNNKKL